MKFKTIIAISASALVLGANLFVISAKQGSVNSKQLLSKVFSFNHFAYALDMGDYGGYYGPTGTNYANGYADCSSLAPESYDINVTIDSNSGQKLSKYLSGGGSLNTSGLRFVNGNIRMEGGNSSDNTSGNSSTSRITGTMYVDVSAARPQYIYCNYKNEIPCVEHTDPCNELKEQHYNAALSAFGF